MNTEKELPAMKKIKVTTVTEIIKVFKRERSRLSNNVTWIRR